MRNGTVQVLTAVSFWTVLVKSFRLREALLRALPGTSVVVHQFFTNTVPGKWLQNKLTNKRNQ